MSLNDFDSGAPDPIGAESRRLAYMLDGAGDPHLAAAELSQDLSGLATPAALNLIRTIQGYEDPNAGVQLAVDPVLRRNIYGFTVDTGTRDVSVIGVDVDGHPVNDLVATLQAFPSPNFSADVNQLTLDPFASIAGVTSTNLFLGQDADYWRQNCQRDRNYWSQRPEWSQYDGRKQGWHPNQTQLKEYGLHESGSLEQSKKAIKNYYDGHEPRPERRHGLPGVSNPTVPTIERPPLRPPRPIVPPPASWPLVRPLPGTAIPPETTRSEPAIPEHARPAPKLDPAPAKPRELPPAEPKPDRQAPEPPVDRGQKEQEDLYQRQQDLQRQRQLDQEQEQQQQKRQQEQAREQARQRERDQHQREQDQRDRDQQQRQQERERQDRERQERERQDQERRDQQRRDDERRQQEQNK